VGYSIGGAMKLNIVSAIAGIIGVLLMCMVAHGASGFFVCKIVGGMPSGVAESGYTAFSYAGETKGEKGERYGMYLITGTDEQMGKLKLLSDCVYLGTKDETLDEEQKPVETKPDATTAASVSAFAEKAKIPIAIDTKKEEKSAVLEVIKIVNPNLKSLNEAMAVEEVKEVPKEEPKEEPIKEDVK